MMARRPTRSDAHEAGSETATAATAPKVTTMPIVGSSRPSARR